jgi:uncharacterized membrane protein
MKTRDLALTGLMIAVVFVITRYFQMPIPQTKGYFNLGEAGIYVAAVLFGPLIGALAGGIGSALADLTSGAAQFAVFTLVIKGIEGLLVGLIASAARRETTGPAGGRAVVRLVAMLVGGIAMVIGYFVAEAYLLRLGVPAALAEVPYNFVQVAAGVVAGLAVAAAFERALPSLTH